MSTPGGVTTSFRLSRSEANLIHPGLRHIVSAHSPWEEQRGKAGCSPRSSTSPHHRKDEGEYNPVVLAIIAGALEKTTVAFDTRRVHLNVFELAASILGVRTSQTLVRHRHLEPWLRNHHCAVRRLLIKLERIRNRGKRAFIGVHGSATFTASSLRWQRGLRFVRSSFLSDVCKRPLLRSRWARRKALREEWLDMFRAELPAAGIEVPPERELRDLVKRALRSGRRYMDYVGLKTAHEHHDELHERIWHFVTDRCRRQREKNRACRGSRLRSRSLIETKQQEQEEHHMLKGKLKPEISTKEHLDGTSKSAKPEQPLGGNVKTPTLRDARLNLEGESERVSGSKGVTSADAVPAIQGEDPDLTRLRVDWPSLAPLDRTVRLKALIAKKHSRRAVAKAIGCSEGSIRHYLSFGLLTDEDKQALQQGSLSGREALKKVHERKVHEQQESVTLNQEQRAKEINRVVQPSLDWFRSLGLPKPCLEQLMDELSGGPFDIRRYEFAHHAPRPWQIPIGKDPKDVIENCRPKEDPTSMYGPDYLNYCFTWGARWTQRVMPDVKLRNTVLATAARQLL